MPLSKETKLFYLTSFLSVFVFFLFPYFFISFFFFAFICSLLVYISLFLSFSPSLPFSSRSFFYSRRFLHIITLQLFLYPYPPLRFPLCLSSSSSSWSFLSPLSPFPAFFVLRFSHCFPYIFLVKKNKIK